MEEFEFTLKAKLKKPPLLVFKPYKHYFMKLEKTEFEMVEEGKNKWSLKLELPEGEYRYQIKCDGEVRIDYTSDVDIDENEELCNKLVIGNPLLTPVKATPKYEDVSPISSPSISALLLEGPNAPPKFPKKNLEKIRHEREMEALEEKKKKEEEQKEKKKIELEEQKKKKQEEEGERKMRSYLLFGEIYSRVFEGGIEEMDMSHKELSQLECEHLAIIEDTLDNLVKKKSDVLIQLLKKSKKVRFLKI